MWKNILLLILFLGVVGTSYRTQQSATKIASLEQEADGLKASLQGLEQKNRELKQKLKADDSLVQAEETQEESALSALSGKIANEKQKQEDIQSEIRRLRASVEDPDARGVESQLKAARFRVAQLEGTLKKVRAGEQDIVREAGQAERNRKQQTQAQIASLNTQIHAVQDAINHTKQDINYWKGQRADPSSSDRIQFFQNQFNVQKAQLAQLNLDKQALQDGNQTQVSSQQEQEKLGQGEMKSQEGSLLADLNRARGELKRLEGIAGNNSKLVNDTKKQILKLEEDYRIQSAHVEEAEHALSQEKTRLDRLRKSQSAISR